jgi:hypothetical protein
LGLALKKAQVKPPLFFPVMAIKIIANGRGLLMLCLLRKKAGFAKPQLLSAARFHCAGDFILICWWCHTATQV